MNPDLLKLVLVCVLGLSGACLVGWYTAPLLWGKRKDKGE